jgi:hypothetical protein
MLDIGRDALRTIGLDDHVSERIGAGDETERSGLDARGRSGRQRRWPDRPDDHPAYQLD